MLNKRLQVHRCSKNRNTSHYMMIVSGAKKSSFPNISQRWLCVTTIGFRNYKLYTTTTESSLRNVIKHQEPDFYSNYVKLSNFNSSAYIMVVNFAFWFGIWLAAPIHDVARLLSICSTMHFINAFQIVSTTEEHINISDWSVGSFMMNFFA